jgi:hypothetical protein
LEMAPALSFGHVPIFRVSLEVFRREFSSFRAQPSELQSPFLFCEIQDR